MLIGLLIILLTLPLFISSKYIISFISLIAIIIIAVEGLNILTGYCGQISLGQAAFMAVGGYSASILTYKLGLCFWLALPCAGLMAGLIGLIFGLPSLRVKGFYLAMATMTAHFVIMWAIMAMPGLTGGGDGMPMPPAQIGHIVFDSQRQLYFIIMPITILMTIFAKNIARTRLGRAFVAVRDNDIAAELMGINIFYYKLLAFFVCSFYAGIAGGLMAQYYSRVHFEQFAFVDGIWYIGMMIIGGMGTALGPIIGVLFVKLLDQLVGVFAPVLQAALPALSAQIASSLGFIVFGLVILLFLIFEPRGLTHRWEIFKASYRLWPYSY